MSVLVDLLITAAIAVPSVLLGMFAAHLFYRDAVRTPPW